MEAQLQAQFAVSMLSKLLFIDLFRCCISPAIRSGIRAGLLICLLGALVLLPQKVWGQASWEYSAYESRVWVVTDGSARLAGVQSELAKSLPNWSEQRLLGVWTLTTEIPSRPAADLLRESFASLKATDILTQQAGSLGGDKLYLVLLEDRASHFAIYLREVDCRTREVGPVIERSVHVVELIGLQVESMLLKAFTPITKIETVDNGAVKARIRAGGMIVDPQSPALIEVDQVLVPIIRRDDRNGEPMKNGLTSMPWTVLAVKTRIDSVLVCEMTSGYRSPIPSRVGARTSRYALVAKPQLPSTRVVLRSRGKGELLAGYEIFTRASGEEEATLLGVTDWRGSLTIPSLQGKLQVLIVKNGNQLLARLPLVPGFQAEAIATTIEDDARLEAEGFVQTFQGRIMDLVARREILASRMRKRIEEKKFDEASKLLEEYRTLENRADLKKVLDVQQQALTSKDKLTQARIDKLLGNANKLNLRFLDPEMGNTLAKELDAAKKSGDGA